MKNKKEKEKQFWDGEKWVEKLEIKPTNLEAFLREKKKEHKIWETLSHNNRPYEDIWVFLDQAIRRAWEGGQKDIFEKLDIWGTKEWKEYVEAKKERKQK